MFQKELDFSSREGLPDSCHFYTVSGSSLPDKTSVSSLSDQIKLQAKVRDSCLVADTASGQNLLSFLISQHKSVGKWACPTIQNKLVMGSLIPLPSFEAWETDQIKLQAMRYVVTLKSYRATVICGIGFGGTLPLLQLLFHTSDELAP